MFGTVLLTILLTAVFAYVGFAVYYWVNRERLDAEQARIQAALRAWEIAQQEQATDSAIRMATHQAINQMMQEARQPTAGRAGVGSGSGGR